jgi:hypothetical protein
MTGPVKNDSQYAGGLPTLVYPSAISGKMGKFGSSPQTSSPVTWNPLSQRGPFSGRSNAPITQSAPTSNPVTYNPGLFPPAGGAGMGGGGVTGGSSFYDRMFSNQNPILQNMGGILGAGIKGNMGAMQPPTGGAGAGGDAGIHPDEKKWKILAEKYGVNWDVTKNVYMRSPRNPNFSPSTALELQLDDKAWGDAALAAGILTGNADYDNQVWIDHYNANGNMASDPMAGHNYAQMAYQANQQKIQDQVNGIPQPPEWLG